MRSTTGSGYTLNPPTMCWTCTSGGRSCVCCGRASGCWYASITGAQPCRTHTLQGSSCRLPCDTLSVGRVISKLSEEELALFRERIRLLDKKLQPGLSTLMWSSKGASGFFISDCCLYTSKVRGAGHWVCWVNCKSPRHTL